MMAANYADQQNAADREKGKTGSQQAAKQLKRGVKKTQTNHDKIEIEHLSLLEAVIQCGGQDKENHADGKSCKRKICYRQEKAAK